MMCSMYSLAVITFDRFMAVTRPLKHKHHSSWTKFAIPAIWVAAIAIPAHYAVVHVRFCDIFGSFYCTPNKSPDDAFLILFLGFALPHLLIFILYVAIAHKLCTRKIPGEPSRDANAYGQAAAKQVARKVTCMIVCILVAFEISWSPLFLGYIFPYLYNKKEASYGNLLFSKALMISNGIFNTLIYAVFNENFRRVFKKTCTFTKV